MDIQVGIVGCGNISGAYARGLARLDGIALVACADVDEARAASAARAYGLCHLGVDELLADPGIAIVVNLTPPLAHAQVTSPALRAGKHVFTEKPLATIFEEAVTVVNQAREAGLVLGSAPDTFLGSAGQTARRVVDSAELGRSSEPRRLSRTATPRCGTPTRRSCSRRAAARAWTWDRTT